MSETTHIHIFIDGSYFCFHRFYSLLTWWKNAKKDEPMVNLAENEIFVEKFKKTFVESIQQIPKKLSLPKNANLTIIVGKDCKRENIWRMQHFPQYKASRVKDDDFQGGTFFKMAYQEFLFQQGGASVILSHPRLEADDCIALSVKRLLKEKPDSQVYIITSDKDYLQLVEPRVSVYDLSFKNIAKQKSSHGDAATDLFCKIVMGDPSDNIPSVLKKCGPVTALQCFKDRDYFNQRLKKEDAEEKYKLNSLLVDFNNIPEHLVAEFYAVYESIL
jgi:5'-3' exonuclease